MKWIDGLLHISPILSEEYKPFYEFAWALEMERDFLKLRESIHETAKRVSGGEINLSDIGHSPGWGTYTTLFKDEDAVWELEPTHRR